MQHMVRPVSRDAPEERSSLTRPVHHSRAPLPQVRKSAKVEQEYEVESIEERRLGKGGAKEYRVRWKGYAPADDTWEPLRNLSAVLDKVRECDAAADGEPGAKRSKIESTAAAPKATDAKAAAAPPAATAAAAISAPAGVVLKSFARAISHEQAPAAEAAARVALKAAEQSCANATKRLAEAKRQRLDAQREESQAMAQLAASNALVHEHAATVAAAQADAAPDGDRLLALLQTHLAGSYVPTDLLAFDLCVMVADERFAARVLDALDVAAGAPISSPYSTIAQPQQPFGAALPAAVALKAAQLHAGLAARACRLALGGHCLGSQLMGLAKVIGRMAGQEGSAGEGAASAGPRKGGKGAAAAKENEGEAEGCAALLVDVVLRGVAAATNHGGNGNGAGGVAERIPGPMVAFAMQLIYGSPPGVKEAQRAEAYLLETAMPIWRALHGCAPRLQAATTRLAAQLQKSLEQAEAKALPAAGVRKGSNGGSSGTGVENEFSAALPECAELVGKRNVWLRDFLSSEQASRRTLLCLVCWFACLLAFFRRRKHGSARSRSAVCGLSHNLKPVCARASTPSPFALATPPAFAFCWRVGGGGVQRGQGGPYVAAPADRRQPRAERAPQPRVNWLWTEPEARGAQARDGDGRGPREARRGACQGARCSRGGAGGGLGAQQLKQSHNDAELGLDAIVSEAMAALEWPVATYARRAEDIRHLRQLWKYFNTHASANPNFRKEAQTNTL